METSVIVPIRLLSDERLSATDKVVWAWLRAYPSMSATRAAVLCGVSRSQWYRSIERLSALEWLPNEQQQPAVSHAATEARPAEPEPEPATGGQWGEAMQKNFRINEEQLRDAIGRARLYCLSNGIEPTEANLRRYTLTELKFGSRDRAKASPHEGRDQQGRFYIWGGYRYDVPPDAPPRPAPTALWDTDRHTWKMTS